MEGPRGRLRLPPSLEDSWCLPDVSASGRTQHLVERALERTKGHPEEEGQNAPMYNLLCPLLPSFSRIMGVLPLWYPDPNFGQVRPENPQNPLIDCMTTNPCCHAVCGSLLRVPPGGRSS